MARLPAALGVRSSRLRLTALAVGVVLAACATAAAGPVAFVALVALANGLLGAFGGLFGRPDLSFQMLLGYVFQPVMFLLNVPWNEAGIAGGLFGEKIIERV